MISKWLKVGMVAASCLASVQSLAQKVATSANQIPTALLSQVDTNSQPIKFSDSLLNIEPTWKKNADLTSDRNLALKAIYEATAQYLKSPLRVQKASGGLDGGGGNAWICEKDGVYSAQLLDLDEALSRDAELDLGNGSTFQEKLDFVLTRLAKVSPVRSAVYRGMVRDLLTKETQWVQNRAMPVIDDVKLTLHKRGCLLVQVAVQRPVHQAHLPDVKTYFIDREMFNLLDEDSKAALVLHEVLYREARFSDLTDSDFTRALVGRVLSTKVLEMNLSSFNDMMEKNGVTCLESKLFPALYSHNKLNKNTCEYAQNFPIHYKGHIRQEPFSVRGLPQNEQTQNHPGVIWSFNGLFNQTAVSKQVYGDVPDSQGFPSVSRFTIGQKFTFEGQLAVQTVPDSKGSPNPLLAANLPAIAVKKGSVFVGYSITSDNLAGSINNKALLDGDITKALAPSVGSLLFYQMIFGETVRIDTATLKFESKSELDSEPESEIASIFIIGNCLQTGKPDDKFQVYVGDRANIPNTKNGWALASEVCFEGNKISEVTPLTKGQENPQPIRIN